MLRLALTMFRVEDLYHFALMWHAQTHGTVHIPQKRKYSEIVAEPTTFRARKR